MIFFLAALVGLMAINALFLDLRLVVLRHKLDVLRRDLDDELNHYVSENIVEQVLDFNKLEKRVDRLETFG